MCVGVAELLLKIGEVAIKHLPELFGSGGDQSASRNRIISQLDLSPWSLASLPSSCAPGSRVDWAGLERMINTSKNLASTSEDSRALDELEQAFDSWLAALSDYHRTLLLSAIEDLAEDAT